MRYEKTLNRKNGDTVVIVSIVSVSPLETKPWVDSFIKVQEKGQSDWTFYYPGYSDRQASMDMSIEEYLRHGRPKMLHYVTVGEYLSARNDALVSQACLSNKDTLHEQAPSPKAEVFRPM